MSTPFSEFATRAEPLPLYSSRFMASQLDESVDRRDRLDGGRLRHRKIRSKRFSQLAADRSRIVENVECRLLDRLPDTIGFQHRLDSFSSIAGVRLTRRSQDGHFWIKYLDILHPRSQSFILDFRLALHYSRLAASTSSSSRLSYLLFSIERKRRPFTEHQNDLRICFEKRRLDERNCRDRAA